MNKVKEQEMMLNKYIDRTSSKKTDKLQWTYKLDFGNTEFSVKLNNN